MIVNGKTVTNAAPIGMMMDSAVLADESQPIGTYKSVNNTMKYKMYDATIFHHDGDRYAANVNPDIMAASDEYAWLSGNTSRTKKMIHRNTIL